MKYDFELWATLPEMETKKMEEEEIAEMVSMELSDEEAIEMVDMLVSCGGETSEEVVEEQMPEIHQRLIFAAEQMARRAMAMRLYEHKCYPVDIDDFFEDDLRTGVFEYQQPDDIEGGLDDEEGYVDAEFCWRQWEAERISKMEDTECVEYLTKRYEIELNMDDVEWGYHLPDELAAEAISKMMK